jgi:RNA polymerase sigma-70 factor (ECF subfamily)
MPADAGRTPAPELFSRNDPSGADHLTEEHGSKGVNKCGYILVFNIEEHMLVAPLEVTSPPFEQEFDYLFRQYHRLVYRTAYAVTGSSQDAEDVLQDVFLGLLRQEAPPEFRKDPKSYFYRAAINLSLNILRARSRLVLTDDFAHFDAPARESENVDEYVRKRLLGAIEKLSARTVEILVLRFVHDYTESEIAKLLRISRGTVAVTLFRSRRRLRRLLRVST